MTMTEAAELIARQALIVVDLGGMEADAALTYAAETVRSNARDARQRTGIFAGPMTTEQLDEWGFLGAVAGDVLDGSIERPSTGNVRSFALAALLAEVGAYDRCSEEGEGS